MIDDAVDSFVATDSETEAASETDVPTDGATSDGDADTGDGACVDGAVQEEACGKCGTRSRLCDKAKWLDWGSCAGETGGCTPGETRDVACERCGTRKETCSATCAWSPSVCTDQKGCVAGTTETRYSCAGDAGSDAGSQTRSCSDTCEWTDWSACP